jgi:hypothetical protein
MPSKKKERSLARKAKKEEAKQQAATSSDGSSCNHIKLPELEDIKEACVLFQGF